MSACGTFQLKYLDLISGARVIVDDSRTNIRCRGCDKKIMFGVTKNGKFIPIIQLPDGRWQAHFVDCIKASQFRHQCQKEIDKNQNDLNNL
ncbi:MAG: hypothetical protein UV20_C0009G0038 [Candidatus Magasanikbacteria bacterium GW2011_GWA2_42_32]|uniref:Uncharacterized protein n=1 Tax=Candidatus Magasanikbacteria bacterium GW2011_GWA2_42_32 TaxID=1619039 RepID=A0A0G1A6I2_9BACT|nr:MAG: hypothetical protein UV20_C0009G0038 [Candidatus Magasanikbacteria bacterium GW2011_GWA2_42_32]HBX15886.1 hypothetical protein [Candidatus Magasanikbacteria bacterium]